MTHTPPTASRDESVDEFQMISEIQAPTRCYFMVVDILGFSQIMTNLNSDEQTRRVQDWLALVETTGFETGVKWIQLISDTLFVRQEDSVDGLARMLRFAQLLLERGLDKNIPLRGAIVHGDAAFGKMTYGEAVIKAHQIERSLDWVGIACARNLPGLEQFWDWDRVVRYAVPRKTGPMEYVGAVAWKVPDIGELLLMATGNGLVDDGAPVIWEPIAKLERTIQFGMYLRMGKSAGMDPQSLPGIFPMHVIETCLKATSGYP